MISADPDETVEGMTQAVLDIRRATAWLAAREEVDPDRSACSESASAASREPWPPRPSRGLQNVCLLLAGGDIARVALDSPS